MIKYPLGIQSFEKLRKNGCVYIDKTDYVYKLAYSGSTAYFLARPRRFGKSLLCTTLCNFFEGKKELFEGLKISETPFCIPDGCNQVCQNINFQRQQPTRRHFDESDIFGSLRCHTR